jgi:hypothetical protein
MMTEDDVTVPKIHVEAGSHAQIDGSVRPVSRVTRGIRHPTQSNGTTKIPPNNDPMTVLMAQEGTATLPFQSISTFDNSCQSSIIHTLHVLYSNPLLGHQGSGFHYQG